MKKIIRILSILGLISVSSQTLSAFIWSTTAIRSFYLTCFVALLAVLPLLFTKLRVAYFLLLAVSLAYLFLMGTELFNYSIFHFDNLATLFYLLVPYFIFTALSLLVMHYLTAGGKLSLAGMIAMGCISAGILGCALAHHYDQDYTDTLEMSFSLEEKGNIKITGRHLDDATGITVYSNSPELKSYLLKQTEPVNGVSSLSTRITKHFRFFDLRSFTLVAINEQALPFSISWSVEEIKGNTRTLLPRF